LVSGLSLILGSLCLPYIGKEVTELKSSDHSPMKAITGQLEEIKSAIESVEDNVKKAVKKTKQIIGDKTKSHAELKNSENNLARGVSGLPMSETPALIGAERGHIECDVDVDELAYWNQPEGKIDNEFKSPFIGNPGVSSIAVFPLS
jgi:hypothetical protein